MIRKRSSWTTVGLIIGGITGSVAAGLMAADYAVGGIDPFYAASHQNSWSEPDRSADAIAIVHDDTYLPSASVTATTPYMPTPGDTAAYAPTPVPDWEAADARAQRAIDRELARADDPIPDVADTGVGFDPAASDPAPAVRIAVAPRPAPTPVVAARPITPGNTLIY
ncbi:MAG: hypothetical protein M3R64_07240 [Pseudomonadota bacterium]|nr:hypothetical protein [Pseudomonadota bacterium]